MENNAVSTLRIIRKIKIVRTKKHFSVLEFFLVSLVLALNLFLDKIGIACLFSAVAIDLFLIIKYRKKTLLLFVLILIMFSNYSFIFGNYINRAEVLEFTFDGNGSLRLLAAKSVLLFNYCMSIFMMLLCGNNKKTQKQKKLIKNEYCPALVILLLVALVLVWVFFYDFSFGNRAVYSPIYEYSTILFIFAFYFSGKNKKLKYITLALALFYILFDFLGGQRSTGFQIALIVFLSMFLKKIKLRYVVILCFIAFVGLNVVSAFRGDGGFNISSVSIGEIVKQMFASGFAFDTAYCAYYSSVVFLYARTFYSASEIFRQSINYLASQFIIGTVGESVTEIALLYHYHFYGGVLPLYLYYYFGVFGIVVGAFLISFYFRQLYNFNSNIKGFGYVFSIYIVSTSVRWYLYSPNQLIRGVILLFIVYIVTTRINVFFGGSR